MNRRSDCANPMLRGLDSSVRFVGLLFFLGLCLLCLNAPVVLAQPVSETGNPSGPEQTSSQGSNRPNVSAGGKLAGPQGSEGGGAQADFDSLIDLIQSTVAPDSWMENGTGEGEISPFVNGVFVDPGRALQSPERTVRAGSSLKLMRKPSRLDEANVRRASPLRFVSLPRLEAAILNHQQRHESLPLEMLAMAGLRRVEYVIVSPESGDLLLAGPAGDWEVQRDGTILSVETQLPVLRLDDLLTLWRRKHKHAGAAFGCSIVPRRAGLAKVQDYLQVTSVQPLEPGQHELWLKELRNRLGKQDVEYFGIDANSHVAQVLLSADYHMKLVGMGLVEGVNGVDSYLDLVRRHWDEQPRALSVLRWWFAMDYDPIEVSMSRDVFAIRGQGVKVLSENELLAEQGKRIHTGQSNELNRQFAMSFTSAFQRISKRYPIYGELRNVFDLALAIAIIEREGLVERAEWLPTLFSDVRRLRLPIVRVPREVESIANCQLVRKRHIVAGVSGGVWFDAAKEKFIAGSKKLSIQGDAPDKQQVDLWWWDN